MYRVPLATGELENVEALGKGCNRDEVTLLQY